MRFFSRRFIFSAIFFSVFLSSLFSQTYPYYMYYYSIPRQLYIKLYNTAQMDNDSIDIDTRVMMFWYACDMLRGSPGVEVILDGGCGGEEVSDKVSALFSDDKEKALEVAYGIGKGNAYVFTWPGEHSRPHGAMVDVMFIFSGKRLRWFVPRVDWPYGVPK